MVDGDDGRVSKDGQGVDTQFGDIGADDKGGFKESPANTPITSVSL